MNRMFLSFSYYSWEEEKYISEDKYTSVPKYVLVLCTSNIVIDDWEITFW